jgi:hypothetical protein
MIRIKWGQTPIYAFLVTVVLGVLASGCTANVARTTGPAATGFKLSVPKLSAPSTPAETPAPAPSVSDSADSTDSGSDYAPEPPRPAAAQPLEVTAPATAAPTSEPTPSAPVPAATTPQTCPS